MTLTVPSFKFLGFSFSKEGEFSYIGSGLRDPDYVHFRQVSTFSPYSEPRTIGRERYDLKELGLL